VQLPFGLALLALAFAWILSDWRIRTLRAVGLLVAASIIAIVLGGAVPEPWGYLAAAAVAAVLALPVLAHHPAVSVVSEADEEMVRKLTDVERMLVSASDKVRAGQGGAVDFRQGLAMARARLDSIKAPDLEWANIIRSIGTEMEVTDSVLRGKGSATAAELRRRRRFIRHAYRDLLRRRSRRWSWLPR
jgi:hypothetical protein